MATAILEPSIGAMHIEMTFFAEDPITKLAEVEYQREVFRRALDKKERHIILEHFYTGRTLDDIANDVIFIKKVNRARVCQIKKVAIRKLFFTMLKDREKINKTFKILEETD